MATTKKKTTVKTQPKVEEPQTVKAFMRISWPGLGKVGEVIELDAKLAKEYVALGVVDTAPEAIASAQKA